MTCELDRTVHVSDIAELEITLLGTVLLLNCLTDRQTCTVA